MLAMAKRSIEWILALDFEIFRDDPRLAFVDLKGPPFESATNPLINMVRVSDIFSLNLMIYKKILVHPVFAYLSDNLLLDKGFQASAPARQKGANRKPF